MAYSFIMKRDLSADARIGPSGLIIYDGGCGVCSSLIAERKAFFSRYGFTIAPLQEKWTQEVSSLQESILGQAIHLVLPNGTMVRGVDFVRHVCAKVWWLIPLSWILALPGFKQVADTTYRFIANRRGAISRTCGLQSRAQYPTHQAPRD